MTFALRKEAALILSFMLLLGQIFYFEAGLLPAAAIDVESMIKEGIKNQIPKPIRDQIPQLNQATAPIKVEQKSQKVEDLVQRQDILYGYPTMIPLQGINIAGLGPKALSSLSENYFVVRSNTGVSKMSDLYRENRLSGKCNYVTVDAVLHPYLAFCNRVHADMIKKHILPLTRTLLQAMLKAALVDYRQADDAEVRADIEANIAFLCMPLKLMDPTFALPNIGRVIPMVKADYDAVVFARAGRSAIYDRNEDFTVYRPEGWYRSSKELITFHRVKTWLSRLNYPINDVTYDSQGVKGNYFRRSVLLYRSLELAQIDGKPAFEQWMKLVRANFLLGSQIESWTEKNVYSHDYKSVFKNLSGDLNVTLGRLAEPLYRTKLLLAVRKQKPMSLSATSIFDLEDAQAANNATAAFRFIPEIGAPEAPWLRWAASYYPQPAIARNIFPVALIDLYSWGAPQAGNFILDSSWAMDEHAGKAIIESKRWMLRRGLTGQMQPVETRIWTLMSPACLLPPDGIQTALRGEMWANRKLETAYAAWLDSMIAIAPPQQQASGAGIRPVSPAQAIPHPASKHAAPKPRAQSRQSRQDIASNICMPDHEGAASAVRTSYEDGLHAPLLSVFSGNFPEELSSSLVLAPADSPAATQSALAGSTAGVDDGAASRLAAGTAPAATRAPGVRPAAVRRAARNHFLDPYPDFFNKLLLDAQGIEKNMLALGFTIEPNNKKGLDDFQRLFQRLGKIARDEIESRPLSPADLSLLGNFDMILEKIDLDLPGVLSFAPPPVDTVQAVSEKVEARSDQDIKSDGVEKSGGSGKTDGSGKVEKPAKVKPAGYTMALGRPGMLYIITQNKNSKEWSLARGAVYTFYEQYGAGLTKEALLSKIDKGTIQPPYWTERFDFVQSERK